MQLDAIKMHAVESATARVTMTLRYMHLAPSELTKAIDLLNLGQPVGSAESAAV